MDVLDVCAKSSQSCYKSTTANPGVDVNLFAATDCNGWDDVESDVDVRRREIRTGVFKNLRTEVIDREHLFQDRKLSMNDWREW